MARVRPTVVVGGFGVVDAYVLAYVHDAVTRSVAARHSQWARRPVRGRDLDPDLTSVAGVRPGSDRERDPRADRTA